MDRTIVFHNHEGSSLVVSVGSEPANHEELDTLTVALNSLQMERIYSWSQRVPSEVGSVIHRSLHGGWTETPIKNWTAQGIYLGHNLVALTEIQG